MNSELYGKSFIIPKNILNNINSALISNPNSEGIKRAKFMLRNGSITYQALERLKNFFNTFNGDAAQYNLAGGDEMKNFVDQTLNSARNGVEQNKEVTNGIHTNPNSDLNAYNVSSNLSENFKKKELVKNALAVIVNGDNKILLLKRAEIKDSWMPGKWGLIGGGIEKGETPENACKREVKEETGLEINKFTKSYSIQRKTDSIEHIFACRYNGESTDIVLDDENTNYGWYDIEEMKYLDIVPHLVEYINLVFKSYEN